MKPYAEYEKTARPGRAFSNSTEWELFQFNVCHGQGNDERRCVNDDDIDTDGGCPLVLLSLDDKTPMEWLGVWRPTRCTEKTTAAETRRVAKQERIAADKAALEAAHYPLFGDQPEEGQS